MTTTRLRPLLLITTLREFLTLTVPILNYSFLLRIAAAGGQLVKVSTKPARDPVSVYLREVEGGSTLHTLSTLSQVSHA
jgi:hypothetical protein